MSRVAIVTDSASDLARRSRPPTGIAVVPARRHASAPRRSGPASTCRPTEFWERMVAPDAPFPTTAASSPGRVQGGLRGGLRRPAPRRSSRSTSRATLSGTIKSAQIARDMLPDREIHVVDSLGASMGRGDPGAAWRVELAADGRPAAEIAETLEARAPDMRHVRRARDPRVPQEGRPDQRAQAAIGDAPVGQADHHGQGRRGRDGRPGPDPGKARERVIELICAAADRAAGDPAHRQPGRRGVPRRGLSPGRRAGSTRPTSRSASSARRSGRTSAPAASARRCCTAA